jgi:hypothetical protein
VEERSEGGAGDGEVGHRGQGGGVGEGHRIGDGGGELAMCCAVGGEAFPPTPSLFGKKKKCLRSGPFSLLVVI